LVVPRIVVLDGFALNPGDLSWAALGSLGSLEIHDRTPPGEVTLRAAGARIALTNKTPLGADAFAKLPELRYVGVLATGTNIVDHAAARARGIVVTNVPQYGADSVAEHTLSLMLEACKHIGEHARAVRDGAWSSQPDFSFTLSPVRLLAGKTLGVVGFGAIGQRVAELARAFKMQVIVARRRFGRAGPSLERDVPGAVPVTECELDEVFRRADFLTLHCPLTPDTTALINATTLGLMKRSAILINTARGGLIDEPALAAALASESIAGAYLDVLSVEPPPRDHVLISEPRCRVTPHMAWASVEARGRLLQIATENVRAFLAGAPTNVMP
jgi:glycerate dehydrogenase